MTGSDGLELLKQLNSNNNNESSETSIATKLNDLYIRQQENTNNDDSDNVDDAFQDDEIGFAYSDNAVLHMKDEFVPYDNSFGWEYTKYNWKGKIVNAGWVTTFNDHAIISENRLTTIPKDFDMRIAPLFGCAVTTAVGVINNDAKVKIGQSVVIFGMGGVGINLAQSASMVSANPIVGIDINNQKLELGKKFGMTHGFNGKTNTNIDDKIKAIVGTKGADVVIDTTGNPRIIEQAYNLTNPDGKTILVGVPKKGENINIYSLPLHFNKQLTGSHGGDAIPDIEIPRLINLINVGKMTLEGLITHEFELNDINIALDLMRKGDCGRILIKM
jgi:S-(hydroxymethyl)glutathione dehydrogenase/alcohol dehydrogenase